MQCSTPADSLTFARRFPESGNSSQFWSNLINGKDMVTKDNRRWPAGLHDTPARFGKLLDISSFDATFFSVHGKQAQVRDTRRSSVLVCLIPGIGEMDIVNE